MGRIARFRDRKEAGQALAEELAPRVRGDENLLVLALPRGGVPVGFEIAEKLGAPLDVFIVRKLGVPGHEELAMGAIATGGVRVLNEEVVQSLGIPPQWIDRVADREQQELERREQSYRKGRALPAVNDATVILVDDGLATGSTMRAAVAALRKMQPRKMIVAVPVAAADTCDQFRSEVDQIVCLRTPEPFQAVGLWYEDFTPTTDQEVTELLDRAARRHKEINV